MKHRTLSVFITLAVISTAALGQLSDFLIATSNGRIHLVDGDTLEATLIVELENGRNISEILYVGNDEILASTVGGFIRYNLSTGVETVEFNIADVLPNPSLIDYAMAAGFTAQRNVYFGIAADFGNGGIYYYGVLYDPYLFTFTETAELEDSPRGLYFDFIETENNVILAANFSDQTARTYDALSGETLSEVSTPVGITSFLNIDDDEYAISNGSGLYTFNKQDGSMNLYGHMTGLQGTPIGATSLTVRQSSDINYDGSRDIFDVLDFLESFTSRVPVADWNDDGKWDFYDVSGFVSDFSGQ